jgi:hypothetical protein
MAQEMSSAARASLDQQQEEQRRPSMVPNLNLNLGGAGDGANDTAGNMWNAVKGWASAAGNSLAETEKEVWKRINRDS